MKKSFLFLLVSLFAAMALAGCLAYVPGQPPMDEVYAPGPQRFWASTRVP